MVKGTIFLINPKEIPKDELFIYFSVP
jgi:hypothetical protein